MAGDAVGVNQRFEANRNVTSLYELGHPSIEESAIYDGAQRVPKDALLANYTTLTAQLITSPEACIGCTLLRKLERWLLERHVKKGQHLMNLIRTCIDNIPTRRPTVEKLQRHEYFEGLSPSFEDLAPGHLTIAFPRY